MSKYQENDFLLYNIEIQWDTIERHFLNIYWPLLSIDRKKRVEAKTKKEEWGNGCNERKEKVGGKEEKEELGLKRRKNKQGQKGKNWGQRD